MNRAAAQSTAPTWTPAARAPAGVLQRACACSAAAGPSGKCGDCASEDLLGAERVQAKLSIGMPGDSFEREADAMADRVVGMGDMSEPAIAGDMGAVAAAPVASIGRVAIPTAPVATDGALAELGRAGGAPLSPEALSYFEPRFGHPLGHVRIHDDGSANRMASDIGARAFTHGSDIYFGEDEFDPGSPGGRHLLAHEITHVFQQGGTGGGMIQRVPMPAPAAGATPRVPPAPAPRADVIALTMCCEDMRMRVETASTNYYYEMDECSLPLGDYNPSVSVDENNFSLDFGDNVGTDQEFSFAYRVEPGQVNPARLLSGQATVPVHVVDHLPRPAPVETPPESERPPTPECVLRLDDRELIPSANFSHQLFSPITVPETELWSHVIPLGWYGWVDVAATARANVQGQLDASYGPGRLSNICLTYLHDRTTSSAPIEHPLLGPGSRADSAVYGIGGQAHFSLPARISVALGASGTLKVAGDYLSTIELAAAEGSLSANGVATLSGSIDADVSVLARMQRNSATLENPLLPLSVTITDSRFDGIDLMAAIGLRGNAALSFRLDAGARFTAFGAELWSERWNLVDFNTGVGWSGGLTYSPNPGLHWDLGAVGALTDDPDGPSLSSVSDLTGVAMHEDAAAIDGPGLLADLFEEAEAPATTPDGLSPSGALPFEWRKPLGLYPATLDIPRAESPHTLNRDDGPTTVQYRTRGRLQSEDLGVSDWPSVGRTFQYMPYAARVTPEQGRFNRVLDALGYSRSGLDAEHVWDVALLGLGYDRFSNLWPASNQDQQLAGSQHEQQMAAYRNTIGNIGGRYFRIVNVRHPAL